ncbi:MAG: aminoacyl-tRNA deacylase [Candidatus Bathyarchaeia archaeon]
MGVLELRSIMELLDRTKIHYTVSEHEPVYTSKQAAKVRGVELKTGVKALVLRTREGGFVMGLVAADRRIDLEKLAEIVGTKSLELASPKDVLETTGCEVGAVHPFGNLHGLPTYVDVSVLENESVNFNAGLRTVSIQMKAKDLVKAIGPVIDEFSRR